MRYITVGFSRPKNKILPIFSWLIRLFEWSPFSHVYIKTQTRLTDQRLIYQASGVQVNFMGEKYFRERAEIYEEFMFEISDEAYRMYLRWAIENAGAPYGFKAVLGIALMRLFSLKRNPFADGQCSQFCSELALRALHDFLGVDVTPQHFETAGPMEVYNICKAIRG